MDKPIEPPTVYTIVFKDSAQSVRCRIDTQTIARIADDWRGGTPRGIYDVEALDGSYRKLALRFEDVLYIN